VEEPQPARLSPRTLPSWKGAAVVKIIRPILCDLKIAILLGGVAIVGGNLPASSQDVSHTCVSPTAFTTFNYPLAHTAERVIEAQPIKVVAIGSSSTAGSGASSSTATYPGRLTIFLQEKFPRNSITVLNRGVNGDEAVNMVVRFERDVIDEHPNLVLWQIGTNVVLRDHPLNAQATLLNAGLKRLKAAGADVVLINPQYAPKVLEKPAINMMIDLISNTAEMEQVNLFNRFAIMRYWQTQAGISFTDFLSADLLHMNDWSYNCVAKLLSIAIADASLDTLTRSAKPRR
jgi:acyl-CoA thioesterase I